MTTTLPYNDVYCGISTRISLTFFVGYNVELDIFSGSGIFKINTAGIYYTNGHWYLPAGVNDEYVQHYSPICAYSLEVLASPEVDFIYPYAQKNAELKEFAKRGDIIAKRKHQLESLTEDYKKLAQYLGLRMKPSQA